MIFRKSYEGDFIFHGTLFILDLISVVMCSPCSFLLLPPDVVKTKMVKMNSPDNSENKNQGRGYVATPIGFCHFAGLSPPYDLSPLGAHQDSDPQGIEAPSSITLSFGNVPTNS